MRDIAKSRHYENKVSPLFLAGDDKQVRILMQLVRDQPTSFDGDYGSGLLARIVGQKKAREIWFLCDQYDAQQALDMGLVNKVVPLADLEKETVAWCRRILEMSPLALRMIKAGMNAADDGLAGIQQLAGDATLLYYMSEEAQEGRDAYVQKRKPDFSKFPKRP